MSVLQVRRGAERRTRHRHGQVQSIRDRARHRVHVDVHRLRRGVLLGGPSGPAGRSRTRHSFHRNYNTPDITYCTFA